MKKFILGLMILLSFIMVGCKDKSFSKTPEDHLMDSITAMQEVKSQQMTGTVAFNIDYDKFQESIDDPSVTKEMIDLLNEVSLSFDLSVKKGETFKEMALSYGFNLFYKDYSLLELLMFLNQDEVGMAMPNFFDKAFTMNLEMLLNSISEEMMSTYGEIDFNKYLELICDETRLDAAKVDPVIYKDVIKAHLKDRLTYEKDETLTFGKGDNTIEEKARVYQYDFDMEGYFEVISELVQKAKDDEALRDYLVALGTDLLDLLESSGDYKLFEITEDDLQEARMMLEEFETNYQTYMDEMYNDLKDSTDMMLDELQENDEFAGLTNSYDMLIYITEEDALRRFSMTMSYEGLAYTVTYDFTPLKDDEMPYANMDKIDLLNFIDLENPGTFKNQELLAETVKDFLLQCVDTLIQDDGYKALYEDLKAFESELGMDPTTIPSLLSFARSYVANMSVDEIISYFDSIMNPYDDYDYDDYDDYAYGADLYSLGFISFNDINSDDQTALIWSSLNDVASVYDVPLLTFETGTTEPESIFQEAVDEEISVIFVYGPELIDALDYYATMYPEIQFVYFGYELYDVKNNIITTEFYNEEVAYVAGYLAGMMTETGTIGFLGAYDTDYYKNFEVAFSDGAIAANPEVYILLDYAESMNDYEYGYKAAETFKNDGADIVYGVAEQTNNGFILGASENGLQFIEHGFENGVPLEGYITSTLVDYEYIIFDILDNFTTYGIEGNYYTYGLYEDVLFLTGGNIPEAYLDELIQVIRDIQDGTLFIPMYNPYE